MIERGITSGDLAGATGRALSDLRMPIHRCARFGGTGDDQLKTCAVNLNAVTAGASDKTCGGILCKISKLAPEPAAIFEAG